MAVYIARQSFTPSVDLGCAPDKDTFMLSFDKGDLLEILEVQRQETSGTWVGARALKDDTVGFIPVNYVKIRPNAAISDVDASMTDDIQDVHVLALEELKRRPQFQHPDELFVNATIPDPDYSDQDDQSDSECKMSPQPNRIIRPSPHTNERLPSLDEGIILPRKLSNPNHESKEKQNLHRELLFNQKIGRNVLGQKSELKKVMDKFQDDQRKKELEIEKLNKRTSLEIRLQEQANKVTMSEEKRSPQDRKEDSEPQSEFHKVYAKVRAKVDSQ